MFKQNFHNLIIITSVMLLSSRIHAIELESVSHPTLEPKWHSSIHFGFAQQDRSRLGTEQAQGSLVMTDLSREFSPNLAFGLRTIGIGGESPESSYTRLVAGPMALISISTRWLVSISAGAYSESIEHGGDRFRAKGAAVMVGWEKRFPLTRNADFSLGGFILQHSGRAAAIQASIPQAPQSDSGFAHGAEISLRMGL